MGNRCFSEMLILFPLDIQEYLENIMGLVRDHCNKVNITIKRVTENVLVSQCT